MKKRRIRFMTHRTVKSISETQEGLRVVIGASPFNETPTAKEKEPVEIFVDTVLMAVGRTPNTDGIGLEQTRVELDERGWVKTDDRMRTADPAIFAVGDVLGAGAHHAGPRSLGRSPGGRGQCPRR